MESHDVSIRTLQRHMEKEKVDHVLFCAFENDLITEKDFRDILDAEKQYKVWKSEFVVCSYVFTLCHTQARLLTFRKKSSSMKVKSVHSAPVECC